jgi:quercetin dioxygenase-like cupin family protein
MVRSQTFDWGSVETLFSIPDCRVDRVRGLKGMETPRHSHSRTVNAILVISGLIRLTLFNDVPYNIRAADCFVALPGKPHRIRFEQEDTELYEVFYPSRGGKLDPSDIKRS